MPTNPHEQIRLVRDLLDAHYDTELSIEDLSQAVALSPYYLIRTFKSIYRQTPHQYLMCLRIARAKDLLRNSDLSITEICIAVGYESLGSFSALFRKVVGLSPSSYRENSLPRQPSNYIPLCVCVQHDIQNF